MTTGPKIVPLNNAIKANKYKKAIKLCKTVTEEDYHDIVHRVKTACLILSENFGTVTSNPESEKLPFELAYALYREGNLKKAEEVLKNSSGSWSKTGLRERNLMAQILYRSKKYKESSDEYAKLRKNGGFEENMNYIAACTHASMELNGEFLESVEKVLVSDEHELIFNAIVAKTLCKRNADFKELEKTNAFAREKCEKNAEEEKNGDKRGKDYPLLNQRKLIDFHLVQSYLDTDNFILELISKKNKNLTEKCVSENLRIIDQNFDPKKRVFQTLHDFTFSKSHLEKLSGPQKLSALVNRALLLFYSSNQEQCNTELESLKRDFPWYAEALAIEIELCLQRKNPNSGNCNDNFETEINTLKKRILGSLELLKNEKPSKTKSNYSVVARMMLFKISLFEKSILKHAKSTGTSDLYNSHRKNENSGENWIDESENAGKKSLNLIDWKQLNLIETPYRNLPVVIFAARNLMESYSVENCFERILTMSEEAIEFWKNNSEDRKEINLKNEEILMELYRAMGEYSLMKGRPEKAVDFLKSYLDTEEKTPGAVDPTASASYLKALSLSDPDKALRFMKKTDLLKKNEFDPQELLQNRVSDKVSVKTFSRRKEKQENNQIPKKEAKDAENDKIDEKELKGKKIDSERWLPLKHRSYYKRKTKREKDKKPKKNMKKQTKRKN